ncbi:MAG: MFS transporter [Humibacter sp.]
MSGSVTSRQSAWAPLANGTFRTLWLVQLGSNIGTWMQSVGAQWFLVDAHAGALLIALVQTATLAPSLIFALPAGVLADVLDRRKLIMILSLVSALIAAVLTVVTVADALSPWVLLAFTFVLGSVASLTSPAWQAIQPELVPREQISAASGLGSVTVNGARAIGPALAGILVSLAGPAVVFAINGLSFAVAAFAVWRWRRPPQAGLENREFFWDALRAGVRYVASAGLIRRILLRSALFALPASALWALLPLTAERLHLQSAGYGLLLGALGVGAVAGVFLLPLARRVVSDNVVLGTSAALFALGTAAAAWLPLTPTVLLLILAGVAWIGTLTVLNAALQLTLPQWVRSRGVAVYLLIFMGAQALGSVVWGWLGNVLTTPVSLTIAAIALVLVAVSVTLLPLHRNTGQIDRTIDFTWPTPTLVFDPKPTDGPVTIMIDYTVTRANRAAFESAMRGVHKSRQRTGASRWRLYCDGDHPDRYRESFVVPSWGEFRRQNTERLTGRDREIIGAALSRVAEPPTESHYFPPQQA